MRFGVSLRFIRELPSPEIGKTDLTSQRLNRAPKNDFFLQMIWLFSKSNARTLFVAIFKKLAVGCNFIGYP